MRVSKKRNMGWFPFGIAAKAGFGSDAGRAAENGEAANETREKLRLGVRTKAADASASGHAALSKKSGSPRMLDAFGSGARVDSRRSPDVVESKSFRLPQVRADTGLAGLTILARRAHIHESRAEVSPESGCAQRIPAKVLQAGDTRRRQA